MASKYGLKMLATLKCKLTATTHLLTDVACLTLSHHTFLRVPFTVPIHEVTQTRAFRTGRARFYDTFFTQSARSQSSPVYPDDPYNFPALTRASPSPPGAMQHSIEISTSLSITTHSSFTEWLRHSTTTLTQSLLRSTKYASQGRLPSNYTPAYFLTRLLFHDRYNVQPMSLPHGRSAIHSTDHRYRILPTPVEIPNSLGCSRAHGGCAASASGIAIS